jgi:hypothetical protein
VSFVVAFLAPPSGFALGLVALEEIRERGEPGRGLALAGVVVGGVLSVLLILLSSLALAAYAFLFLVSAGFIPLF